MISGTRKAVSTNLSSKVFDQSFRARLSGCPETFSNSNRADSVVESPSKRDRCLGWMRIGFVGESSDRVGRDGGFSYCHVSRNGPLILFEVFFRERSLDDLAEYVSDEQV